MADLAMRFSKVWDIMHSLQRRSSCLNNDRPWPGLFLAALMLIPKRKIETLKKNIPDITTNPDSNKKKTLQEMIKDDSNFEYFYCTKDTFLSNLSPTKNMLQTNLKLCPLKPLLKMECNEKVPFIEMMLQLSQKKEIEELLEKKIAFVKEIDKEIEALLAKEKENKLEYSKRLKEIEILCEKHDQIGVQLGELKEALLQDVEIVKQEIVVNAQRLTESLKTLFDDHQPSNYPINKNLIGMSSDQNEELQSDLKATEVTPCGMPRFLDAPFTTCSLKDILSFAENFKCTDGLENISIAFKFV